MTAALAVTPLSGPAAALPGGPERGGAVGGGAVPAAQDPLAEAEGLLAGGRYPEAIDAFRQVLRASPGSRRARLGLALALLAVADRDGARRTLQPLLASDLPAEVAAAAEVYLQVRDFSTAQRILAAAVERWPRNAELRAQLGRAYAAAGRRVAAEEALREALAIDPGLASAHHLLGVLLTLGGQRLEEGLAALERAAALAPGDAGYRFDLGAAYLDARRYREAAAVFEELVEHRPGDARAWLQLGRAYIELHRLPEAVRAFQACLAAEPAEAAAAYRLGYLYWRMGQAEDSERYYRLALERRPSDAAVHFGLGVLLYQTGRFVEAQRSLEAALAAEPRHADALYFLGKTLAQLGEVETAMARLRECVAVEPGHAKAWYQLAMLYRRAGQPAAADRAMDRFRELARRADTGH